MKLLKHSVNTSGRLHAVVVIVLYGMTPEESPAFRSLIEARANTPPEVAVVSIVVWDNSPTQKYTTDPGAGIEYYHDPRNPGLATAYNQALEIAARQRAEWLITLDQDSTVPNDYLHRLASAARDCASGPDVGAIVPQIAKGDKRLSPYYFALGAIPRWHSTGFRGIPAEPVFAFNSGAMFRVEALRQIGGYDLRFPLEYSDTALFCKLHEHGKGVFIEGSIQLLHEFSLIEMNQLLSQERYRRTLLAETALWDLRMNRLAGWERTLRLLLRMIRHWMRGDRSELRRVTADFLLLRIFSSKKSRLRKWRVWLSERRLPDSTPHEAYKQRPKVSVCMAAYNGEKYIQAQLHSILSQLAADDEIVIVDDGSQDETVALVMDFDDSRIHLLAHENNQGVVATFEDALRSATGEILFLCDDDDLWHPAKVQRVLREFEQNPGVNIVTSRVALIDEQGLRLPDARVNRYGRFHPGF